MAKDSTITGHMEIRRHHHLLEYFFLIILASLPFSYVAEAQIKFDLRTLNLQGLPDDFLATCWTLADPEGTGTKHLVIAGDYFVEDRRSSGVYLVNFGRDELRHVKTILVQPNPPIQGFGYTSGIAALSSCDFDNDGRDEIFISHEWDPSRTSMIVYEDGEYVQKPPPFPLLYRPVLAWLDYNRDGWVDLFLSGLKPVGVNDANLRNKIPTVKPFIKLLKNNHGRLEQINMAFDPQLNADSAHTIDFDGDSNPDLFISLSTHELGAPIVNRIFVSRENGLDEIKLPFLGTDRLIGTWRTNVACGDLDGDGLSDLLITGCWDQQLGTRAFISIPYNKRMDNVSKQYYLEYDDDRFAQIPDIVGEYIIADLDGDGDNDLFGYGPDRNANFIIVCLENSQGDFTPINKDLWTNHRYPLLEMVIGGLVVSIDINSDGLLDFVCFSSVSGQNPILLMNCSEARGGNGGGREGQKER